ncbi:MAG TPA: TetR/AcrR family transcriptional regulator [Anaeromyxobacteraceae bacterium]|nr:TetR/AcrR family transcriptional regulator [Anaeromyxobacteraceae bacterium]
MNQHSKREERCAKEKACRLRDRLKQATREAILEASEAVFSERGFTGARMEEIAARAGVAVGTLYNRFADRQSLWSELCHSRREALLVKLDDTLERVRAQPFEDALRAMLATFVDHWAAHRGFLSVLMQVDPPTSLPGPRARNRTMAQELLRRVRDLVRVGIDQGVLRVGGADLYPELLLGMLRSVLFHHLENAPSTAAAADVEHMVRVFLYGARRAQ